MYLFVNAYHSLQEIVYHLPDLCERYGSMVDISTYGFEAMYHHLLGDFHSSSTTNFCSIVGERFVNDMNTSEIFVKRYCRMKEVVPELEQRASAGSVRAQRFLSTLSYRDDSDSETILSEIRPEDEQIVPGDKRTMFSKITRRRITLVGSYYPRERQGGDNVLLYDDPIANRICGGMLLSSPFH